MDKKPLKRVVAGIIINNNLIFCAQRKNQGECANKWEFPGGKIENNETETDALLREIKEELNLTIDIKSFVTTVNYEYKSFILRMSIYTCIIIDGIIKLTEHQGYKWLELNRLEQLDWAKADLALISQLVNNKIIL